MVNFIFYQKFCTPFNGRRVMLHLLTNQNQGDDLIKMFMEAPPEDTLFLKQHIKDPNLIKNWLKQINYRQVIPLLALDMDDKRIIAEAHIDRGQGGFKHVGEIQQIYVSRPFQNCGLGSLLIDHLIELAQEENLHWLKAEVVTEHKIAIKAFLNKGFKIKATLEDFFLSKNGLTYDVALMTRPVPGAVAVADDEAEEF
jgi:L-amino acid N-acyltransferase YncA